MTFLMSGYTSAVQKLHYRRAQFYNPDLFDSLHDWRNNSVLRVHNLSGEPREVRLSVDADEDVCSPIFCPATTANPTPAVGTACCSNLTAIVGSACAAWITCSNAPPSNPDNATQSWMQDGAKVRVKVRDYVNLVTTTP
jgi:hypothetical protein